MASSPELKSLDYGKYRHTTLCVCIPVFNEEKFILDTLHSVRRQTFSDFICVIRDNGSTDKSFSIIKTFCSDDPRFFYERSRVNEGAAKNFQILRELTSSPFIMWLGAHDRLDPSFLDKCLSSIIANPLVSLCYSRVNNIDESDELLHVSDGGDYLISHPLGIQRFVDLSTRGCGECTAINGIIRRSSLVLVPSFPQYDGPDNYILAVLQYQGYGFRVEEPLYYRRHLSRSLDEYSVRLRGKTCKLSRIFMLPMVLASFSLFWKFDEPLLVKLIYFPRLFIGMICLYKASFGWPSLLLLYIWRQLKYILIVIRRFS